MPTQIRLPDDERDGKQIAGGGQWGLIACFWALAALLAASVGGVVAGLVEWNPWWTLAGLVSVHLFILLRPRVAAVMDRVEAPRDCGQWRGDQSRPSPGNDPP